MKIAVASGKGGTGKTTISTNLALYVAGQGYDTVYFDCDVEEPNGHLFLRPVITKKEASSIPVPVIDESKCNACGECVRFCEYKALVRLGKIVMVFPELCHGCVCTIGCPNQRYRNKRAKLAIMKQSNQGNLYMAE